MFRSVRHLVAAVAASVIAVEAPAAPSQPHRALYAVGGGYEVALEGYSREAMFRARGGSVLRLLMVPAAFAEDPPLPEDPLILAEDVAALQAACDKVIDRERFPSGCAVGSVPLYVAADARNATIVTALSDPTLDGIFFTGGDQGYAARILADTPAEAAMAVAAERGVVFGGTSAGAAIQSLHMNAGYTDAGDSTNALQKGSIDLWLGQDGKRGLRFGSRRVVIDEHTHSRGRLGRMVNASAQTADALGRGGLLGIGFDYDTGAALGDDRWLTAVAGVSSALVVDLRTAGASHAWTGPDALLRARRVLTHVLPPRRSLAFDVAARLPWLGGRPVPFVPAWRDAGWRSTSDAVLMLGGDVSDDLGGPVLREFVRRASRDRLGAVEILAAGFASTADAQALAERYADALVLAGWRGSTRIEVHGRTRLDPARAAKASGVLLLGGDQSLLAPVLADPAFTGWVRTATRHARVVMTERAMTAAAGEHYDAIGEGDSADDAIAAFTRAGTVVRPGLGLVADAAFESRLQVDRRWGRLYGLVAQRPRLAVFGIAEGSALVIDGARAEVAGRQPVFAIDGRSGTFFDGDNGAFGALNVLMDVLVPGDTVRR